MKRVFQTVEQNKVFKFMNRRDFNKIVTAIRHYYTYIKELNENKTTTQSVTDTVEVPKAQQEPKEENTTIVAQELPTESKNTHRNKELSEQYPIAYKRVFESLKTSYEVVGDRGVSANAIYENTKHIARVETIEEILDNVSWAIKIGNRYVFKNDVTDEEIGINQNNTITEEISSSMPDIQTSDKEKQIDFNDLEDLAFTKPFTLTYFGEETSGLSSWTDLYVTFVKFLYEDYPDRLPVGQYFHGASRIDFGNKLASNNMVAPKQITDDLYVETNLSATNIVGKIKALLEHCLVDFENVVITYKAKENNTASSSSPSQRQNSDISNNKFYNWLKDRGMAEATCRNYVSSVTTAEQFARTHNLKNCTLFDTDFITASATFDELCLNEEFSELNIEQHNRFSAAIKKLLEYLRDVKAIPQIDTTNYEKVLAEKFIRGFRVGSGLDMRKFKRFYEEIHSVPLDIDDDEIERNISFCCIRHEDRLYLPEIMLSEELREKLFEYIRNSFAEGKNAIYYEALFTEFSEDFLDYYIYNAEMLKTYISHYNNGEFYMDRNYISKEAFADVNPFDEVKQLLTNAKVPMEAEVVCQTLSHIPETKVMQILGMNSEFVYNGYGVYFHIDIIQLSDEDLDNISTIIKDGISEKEFLSGNELIDIIKVQYPHIIDNNASISTLGMRDAIKYHLKDKFSFNGNIISTHGQSLSMSDVFGQYARSRNEFDMAELDTLAAEMNTVIYFQAVYENSLRVSKTRFVSKSQAQFKVYETDKAIDRFCTGEYIPLKQINEFGTFPDAGFQWNTFLLAHYVYSYSKNYIFFGGFNKNASVGAIVKRNMGINNYDDFLAVALSESGIILNKENALEYMVEQGYIARRSCSTIEEILIKANAHRNTKGTD